MRSEVATNDTWNLSVLFKSREEWDKSRMHCLALLPKIAAYEGTLKEDADYILSLFILDDELSQKMEFLAGYAQLEYSADSSNTNSQELMGLLSHLISEVSQSTFFIEEELSSLSLEFLEKLRDDQKFIDYKMGIISLIRAKPHILSKSEEKLLSQQTTYTGGFHKAFSALNDLDMVFGTIDMPDGPMPLTHSTLSLFMEHDDRTIRKTAYEKFHTEHKSHINTIACLFASSVQQDNATAKIRNYSSTLEKKLYNDNIPLELYHNLIKITHQYLPVLHKYYALLQKQFLQIANIKDFAIYDTSAPPFPAPKHNMKYEKAVELVCTACAPLGEEYTTILHKGLLEDRWVDRYENKGKRSGAFSMGLYGAYPYIMMNYQENSLQQVFTLAHEAGHSMHSYFASKKNAISQHSYSIFEAEVASTVNEFLLYKHLIQTSKDQTMKTYLIWHELQGFISTFFRQTMFAEFELKAHECDEQGNPLTVDFFTNLSIELYKQYSGNAVIIPELSGITCLRIPHFYRSYYVYKYATGIAAAVDIGTRIFNTEQNAVEGYFDFLYSGGSRFPIDALKLAGVDYNNSTAISNALTHFEKRYMLLETLCNDNITAQ